jgi:hypothetical protein
VTNSILPIPPVLLAVTDKSEMIAAFVLLFLIVTQVLVPALRMLTLYHVAAVISPFSIFVPGSVMMSPSFTFHVSTLLSVAVSEKIVPVFAAS